MSKLQNKKKRTTHMLSQVWILSPSILCTEHWRLLLKTFDSQVTKWCPQCCWISFDCLGVPQLICPSSDFTCRPACLSIQGPGNYMFDDVWYLCWLFVWLYDCLLYVLFFWLSFAVILSLSMPSGAKIEYWAHDE